MVGASGFEPPTSRSRTVRSTKLSYAPTGAAAYWRDERTATPAPLREARRYREAVRRSSAFRPAGVLPLRAARSGRSACTNEALTGWGTMPPN